MQASIPKLSDLVDDNNVNIVEIYSSPEYIKDLQDTYMIPVRWPKPLDSFSLDNPQNEIQYYHRDLCYTFDVDNDAQRGFRRIVKKEMFYKNLYIIAMYEESVPSHRFPCTQDISLTSRITRHTQRINNRLSWIYEKDENDSWISYIRYNHAPNVEMTKMQGDLERTIARMPKPQSKEKEPSMSIAHF